MSGAPHLVQPVLRYADEEEAEAFLAAVARGFHEDYLPERMKPWRSVIEWHRAFGFAVDRRWIATCAAFSRTMAVPGGRQVPTAAVTMVTVAPSFRRRGLLTEMKRHLITRLAEQGREPVALLWASESMIYGRYGYGSATPSVSVSGATRSTAFRPEADLGDGSTGEVTAEEFRAAVVPLHGALLPARPGALDRPGGWWDHVLDDQEHGRDGASAYRYVLHYDRTGVADGHAFFRTKGNWGPDGPVGELLVRELDAATPQAHAALWRHLLDLDLIRRFSMGHLAGDDPLRHLVADQRAVSTKLCDATYARIVDLPAALEARAYGAEVDVVLQVSDPLLPVNEGRFRLVAGPEGASVTRTESAADLRLGIRELSAAYLGGTPLTALARAGWVVEERAGSLTRAGNAFGWHRQPFCPDHF